MIYHVMRRVIVFILLAISISSPTSSVAQRGADDVLIVDATGFGRELDRSYIDLFLTKSRHGQAKGESLSTESTVIRSLHTNRGRQLRIISESGNLTLIEFYSYAEEMKFGFALNSGN